MRYKLIVLCANEIYNRIDPMFERDILKMAYNKRSIFSPQKYLDSVHCSKANITDSNF